MLSFDHNEDSNKIFGNLGNREPRCLKCAGSYQTIDCKTDRKLLPKCSDCLEAHTANYRGQTTKKLIQTKKFIPKNKSPPLKSIKGVSYAEVNCFTSIENFLSKIDKHTDWGSRISLTRGKELRQAIRELES
uniref:Uncharacterized protein n=1 Tax=Megaselia scalaris TaxID=36166 RepID=T1GXQ8_MEGSC